MNEYNSNPSIFIVSMDSDSESRPLINVLERPSRPFTQRILNWTPVELLVILHTIAIVALGPVQTYYVIDVIGRKYGQEHLVRHAEVSCHPGNKSNKTHTNDTSSIIQKESAEMLMYLGMCSTFGSVLPLFLLGYFSDLFGRRLMWIINICGTIFKELLLLFTILFSLPLWVLYIGQIGFALTGTYGGAMSQIFATVSDITAPGKDRAFLITVVQTLGMFTSAVTNYFMGYWIWTEKFYQPLIMTLAISVLTIIFGVMILKSSTNDATLNKERLLAPLKLYLKNNTRQRRRNLLVCLGVFLLSSSCLFGKLEYQTLFLMHKPICWNEFQIQVMHAVQTVVNTICVVGVVRLFLRYTQDTKLLVLGSISGILSMIMLGVSENTWMVYLHVVYGFISVSVFPVARALMSSIVDPHEQGFLFASIAGFDELSGALTSVVYGKLYKASVDVFSGLIFLVMAGVFCFALFGSILLNYWLSREPRSERRSHSRIIDPS